MHVSAALATREKLSNQLLTSYVFLKIEIDIPYFQLD